MNYLPSAYRNVSLAQGELACLNQTVSQPTIVRRAKCVSRSYNRDDEVLTLGIEGLGTAIKLSGSRKMTFGTESISMFEYFKRVVEEGDLLDFVLDPKCTPQISYFWIHIEYMGAKLSNLQFSQKDDGLFAMRTKAGEKAERLVTKDLVKKYDHQYPEGLLKSSGTFQIRYEGKKQRKPDRICACCGLNLEVKKRNKDSFFRISHSKQRTFQSENQSLGWHAFVFPDMSIHYVSNHQIIQLLEAKQFVSSGDSYDKWIQLNKECVQEELPPNCQSA